MKNTERFYITKSEDSLDACFLMKLNVGVIKPQGKGQVTFEPPVMVQRARQALIAHVAHRPSALRRQWEEKLMKLTDMLIYWTMMEKLGFTSLPIVATPEGKYIGHPLCVAEEEVVIVDSDASASGEIKPE